MKNATLLILLTVCTMSVFSQVKQGSTAAELQLPGTDGKPVSLSSLKGKVVLIDFWASWCAPCRKNNPHLVHLYNKFHDKGFEIYGVSLDNDSSKWITAIAQDKLKWIQVNDNKGWDASSALAYNVDAIPASFLIDKEGIIRGINLHGWELEMAVKDLLKKSK